MTHTLILAQTSERNMSVRNQIFFFQTNKMKHMARNSSEKLTSSSTLHILSIMLHVLLQAAEFTLGTQQINMFSVPGITCFSFISFIIFIHVS